RETPGPVPYSLQNSSFIQQVVSQSQSHPAPGPMPGWKHLLHSSEDQQVARAVSRSDACMRTGSCVMCGSVRECPEQDKASEPRLRREIMSTGTDQSGLLQSLEWRLL